LADTPANYRRVLFDLFARGAGPVRRM